MGPCPLRLEEVIDMKLSHQSSVVVSLKEIVIYGVLQIVSYDPYSMKWNRVMLKISESTARSK